MHGSVSTTGPLIWGLLVLGILTCGLALLLAVDALRRPSQAFATVPETRWPYVAVGGVYALAYAAWWFTAVKAALPWVGHIVLFGAPVVIAAGAAYLLRVVFPKHPLTLDAQDAPVGRVPESDPSEESYR